MILPVQAIYLEKNGGEKAALERMTEADLPAVFALRDKVGQNTTLEHYVPSTDEQIRECLEKGMILGAKRRDGQLISFAMFWLNRPSQYALALGFDERGAADMVDVDDIAVDPAYRGNQMQALYLQLIESLSEAQGKRVLLASASPNNAYSLRNLERQRFLTQGVHPLHGQQRYILKKGIGENKAKRALLLIDYTYDFVAVDGKLTAAPAALGIEDAIAAAIRLSGEMGDVVCVLNDIHYKGDRDHPESKLFPPHNIAGTPGRELYGKVKNAVEEVEAAAPERVLRLDKTRYSAFARTPLDEWLKKEAIKEVQLLGVCTDICVLHTAVDAYNLGYDIIVDEAEVASFNAAAHDVALAHFAGSMGATVIPRV